MPTIKIIKFDTYRYRIQTHEDGIYDMSDPMELSAINRILEAKIDNLKFQFWELKKMYQKAKRHGYESTMIQMYELMKIQKKEHDNYREEYIKLNCKNEGSTHEA